MDFLGIQIKINVIQVATYSNGTQDSLLYLNIKSWAEGFVYLETLEFLKNLIKIYIC